ncbi:MAG: AAA family ATPase [Campylobacter sp.]|nr:AAA family ATPase [Campylobacter sp.]
MKEIKQGGEVIDLVDLENSNLLLTPKDIADYNPKWLIKGFIEANKLISLYAMPGSGKSITALFLATHMLEIGVINKVIYVDMDNGLATLKNRNIKQILNKFGDKLKYISSAKKAPKDIDPKTLIFSLSALADESQKDTLIIFDSIRNFINGSMSYDEVVMPTLDAMQHMRDYYAGVWFLNHQNKQDFMGENNKAYKGATAFFDSCDEAYFVKKKERKETKLTVTLEPMKQRDDTKPQAVIIDTANLSIEFDDFFVYAMNDKQSQAIEYAKEIIAQNPNGTNMQSLVNEIKRQAKIDEVEICGINALKKLLKEFNGRFYKIETNSNRYNFSMFYPLS